MVGQQKVVTETITVCSEITEVTCTQNKNPFDLAHQRNHNLNIWGEELKYFLNANIFLNARRPMCLLI